MKFNNMEKSSDNTILHFVFCMFYKFEIVRNYSIII